MKSKPESGTLFYILAIGFGSIAGGIIVVLILLSLSGCSLFTKPANATIHIPGLTLHIVGDKSQTPCKSEGCAKGSEIWIVGESTSKGIVVDNWTLGHELRHVLWYWETGFTNPDKEN